MIRHDELLDMVNISATVTKFTTYDLSVDFHNTGILNLADITVFVESNTIGCNKSEKCSSILCVPRPGLTRQRRFSERRAIDDERCELAHTTAMVAFGRSPERRLLPGPDIFDSDTIDAAVVAHAAPTEGGETAPEGVRGGSSCEVLPPNLNYAHGRPHCLQTLDQVRLDRPTDRAVKKFLDCPDIAALGGRDQAAGDFANILLGHDSDKSGAKFANLVSKRILWSTGIT